MKALIFLILLGVIAFVGYEYFFADSSPEKIFVKNSSTSDWKVERQKLHARVQELHEKRKRLEKDNEANSGKTVLGEPAATVTWRRETIAKIRSEISTIERRIADLDAAIQKEEPGPR